LASATAVAFGRVFEGGGAVLKVVIAALASAAVASALERRNLLLATLASAILMVTAVGLLVLPATTWHGLPTLETLRVMSDSAALVGEQARVQVAPTPPLVPLMLAAITAIWAAVFSSHALAFRAGSPLLALLPPIALLTFADTVLEEIFRPGYGVLFLLGALAVVFVDGLRRVQRWGPLWAWPGSKNRLAPATTRGAGRVSVGALVIAGFAPLFLPGIGTTAVIDLSGSASDDIIRIDPQVALATALNGGTPRVVFTVQTDHPTYYRVLALDRFDGNAWSADFDAAGAVPVGAFTGGGADDDFDQTFSIKSTVYVDGVPAAYPLESLDLPLDDMTYDVALDNLYTDGPLEDNTIYHATSRLNQPDPNDLENFTLPADKTAYARWLALPATFPDRVTQLAQTLTQTTTTMYDAVRKIQDYLKSDGGFTYDGRVDLRDDTDALETFLFTTKAGFCVQFASSMAVMLRSIGIPARVVVGFTTGTRGATTESQIDTPSNLFTVTTKDAHSWVEAWFGPDYGWLRFEPTPGTGRVDPIAAAYYDQAQIDCQKNDSCGDQDGDGSKPPVGPPVQVRNSRPGFGIEGDPGTVPFLPGGPRGPNFGGPVPQLNLGSEPGRPYGLYVLVAGIALLLLVPPIRGLGRRRRLRRAAREPRRLILVAYEVFTERAAMLGFGRAPGETLEEYRVRLATSGLLQDGHLDRLTSIAGRAAYAAAEPAPGDPAEAVDAAHTTLKELRRGTSLVQRVVGLYRPQRPV
jgi:transglutaminase-like putative cysteine protease